MPVLVDGDNLLGTWPGRGRSPEDKRRLAAELVRHARALRRRIVVVFDGPAPDGPRGAPDVVYSGPHRSADEVILDRVRDAANPRGWIVVTSDRSLGDRCRWRGTRVERCDRFRNRLRSDPDAEKPEGPVDVEDWMAWFGDDGDGA